MLGAPRQTFFHFLWFCFATALYFCSLVHFWIWPLLSISPKFIDENVYSSFFKQIRIGFPKVWHVSDVGHEDIILGEFPGIDQICSLNHQLKYDGRLATYERTPRWPEALVLPAWKTKEQRRAWCISYRMVDLLAKISTWTS